MNLVYLDTAKWLYMCVFDVPATFLEVRAAAVSYSVGKWKKIK